MAVKKTSRKKDAAPPKSTVRSRLEAALSSLLPGIDDEGLIFLLKQANVLVNNTRVDRINRGIMELQNARRSDAEGQADPGGKTPRNANGVAIEEQGGGKVFFLNIGETRKVLSLEELRRIIRICRSAGTKSEALRQLYTVLSRERNDILFDAHIQGAAHPLLEALYAEVRSRYRLKEG